MGEFARAVRGHIDQQFISAAKNMGERLRVKDNASTSQIRRIFTVLKTIEMRQSSSLDLSELLLLKPRLSYASAKDRSLDALRIEVSEAIDVVAEQGIPEGERSERFRRLCQAFEAVLAYYSAKGDSHRSGH